ncbi:O-antigen ligase domain-containing protein [Nocardioides guangzhouensis]|uniref:O-antigen ligase domain-containing protein n=1 Tax=Nocardioides guangzhouensis TaxID=2497878 RepID=A0A4Q4ZDV3_9ACTN|nr:O-antigen ligase family protein [Nocardioides guangzhouensis]RYP85556.1 O-antigen ligase domain-containing protein [Nocardioides guangzhouensis]
MTSLQFALRRTGPRAREVPWSVQLVWAALYFNVLTVAGNPTILPIPGPLGQLANQAALPLALLLALAANRGGLVRPSLFLVLLTVLSVVSLMVSLHSEFPIGSTYRSLRLAGFVLVLWLTTRWWGRSDMLLLRCHRRVLGVIVGSVVVGALVAPGYAFGFDGRLAGAVWPIPPTQVAHYSAVLVGTSAVLWLCRVISSRNAAFGIVVPAVVMLLTHTRTALLGLTIGLAIAAASLFLGHVRVRRTSALGAVAVVALTTVFASQVKSWALRGESAEDAGQLTGRTKVWSDVFSHSRPPLEDMFGTGLSNNTFRGLAIDSSWVANYVDQGWFGVLVDAALVLVLLLMAASHRRGPERAVALFLVVYCIVASITETGLGTASTYTLDLAIAASLLAAPGRDPMASAEGGGARAARA